MTPRLPSGSTTTESGSGEAAIGPNVPDRSATGSTTKEQKHDPSDLQVNGCVDFFTPPNLLGGWAVQEGRGDPLNIKVLLDGRPIGTGQTGQKRSAPAANCGFSVSLSQPITMAQVRRHVVTVHAIDDQGQAHKLPIWAGALRRVEGCVDSFNPPNVVSGWAQRESADGWLDEPLDLVILLDGIVIGTGRTGEKRLPPAPGCGFTITLWEPITAADICSGAVEVQAIDSDGEAHKLGIWSKLLATLQRDLSPDDQLVLPEVRRLIARKAFAASRPYATDGVVLPPACTAPQLRSVIESEGLFGFVPELSVPEVLALLDRDSLPVPREANRQGYMAGQDTAYWLSGLDDHLKVKACWEKYLGGVNRIFDFGGATGRVFRHFYCQAKIKEVSACDAKRVNVEWCKKYFPADMRVFLNAFHPGLPFADGYFDMITAFSVFTHIDEFEDGWLLELSRVLRPEGLAYLTISDEETWAAMSPHLEGILRSSPDAKGVNLRGPMPFDRMAFRLAEGASRYVTLFHRQDYIRRFWSRYFRVEQIIPKGHGFQTVLVLRNKRNV
jgi:SAM-dependent methyltransferase